MKYISKTKAPHLKGLFISGLLAVSLSGIAQSNKAVIADAELGQIAITDVTGYKLDPNSIQQEQLLNLNLPVSSSTHGKGFPAGTCKIKIGFGSKLALDPGFDISTAGMGSYFKWTSVVNGGQVQVTGDLIRELPADIKSVDLAFRVKASNEGKSTITANFLITNHNTATVLSDENGANNSSYLSYKVIRKFDLVPATLDGKLKLSVFPNPAKNVSSVSIKLKEGRLNGKYKISLYEISGKLIQTKELKMDFVTNFNYAFGNIAPGKYLIKVASIDAKELSVLKFEKL